MYIICLLALLCQVPTYDEDDPKVSVDPASKLRILVSDQKDFETEFVKECLDIPDDIVTRKIKKFHLENWLRVRRELNFELIEEPSVAGPPLISYSRYERPRVLNYPYKAIPHPIIFIKHLIYLYDLANEDVRRDVVRTQQLRIELSTLNRTKGIIESHNISFCVDDVKFPVSPLLGYKPFPYIKFDNDIVYSNGPTVEEQFHLLDAGTGFLTNDSRYTP